MKNENVRVWITKYALSDGILVVDGTVHHSTSSTMLTWGGEFNSRYAHGNEWHRTQEAAIARAEEMRKAKIASLRRRIEKMEALQFHAVSDVA